ncbi:trace amine-associated receptor 13c-like [Nematolebias whitei]|uniref:trace amine-associated receptor 13c-like n=1 Tax=Nematolebias whitei TaxID=451745 RepID=UPI00189718B8|nr:trace amine-associated receptor 13c-like [Nematolebias whitei]
MEGAELCFPQLLNSSCRKPMLHWSEAVLLNTALSFISLITVILNLLVIISVSHFRQLQKPTNILLLSLAVSDFLVGFLLIPLEIFRSTACWLLGDSLCTFCSYIACVVLSASIGNVVLISIDRYVAICKPLHYPIRITVARVKFCVCLCWLLSVVYIILFLRNEFIQSGKSNSCIGECELSITFTTGTVDLFISFLFPVAIIIVLYMRVFMVAVAQARAMNASVTAVTLQHSVNLKPKKSELKAARTLGVLVIVFLICWCPYYSYSVISGDLPSTSYASFLFFLFYFNSCLNPVIYALFYPWFRKAVKLIATLQILHPAGQHFVEIQRTN